MSVPAATFMKAIGRHRRLFLIGGIVSIHLIIATPLPPICHGVHRRLFWAVLFLVMYDNF